MRRRLWNSISQTASGPRLTTVPRDGMEGIGRKRVQQHQLALDCLRATTQHRHGCCLVMEKSRMKLCNGGELVEARTRVVQKNR
jgi:hypothetical protein